MAIDTRSSDKSPFNLLRDLTGEKWGAIRAAREAAVEKRHAIEQACKELSLSPDLAFVVYGSLAREEWTSGSDVDWTLLVDGASDASHYTEARQIHKALSDFNPPGTSLTFGTLSSSFDLIHNIGGQEDTNGNLTRRILLLLESLSVNDSVVHERVLRGILTRYVATDPAVSASGTPRFRTPLFLLNDIVRLWRTIAVDYATKKWQQENQKWAIRNIKLRMSRKLLFVKGLLLCFDCELQENPVESELALDQMVSHCVRFARRPAIDVLCDAILASSTPKQLALAIVSPYDKFLSTLDDPSSRKHLEALDFDAAEDDELFQELRRASHTYRDGLNKLFFDDSRLAPLTRMFGVF